MKNLKIYAALIIMVMISCTDHIIAQAKSKNDVPENIIAEFTAKYPNAKVKSWNTSNDGYIVKAKENGSKFYVTFDKNGQWVQTTTQVSWSWQLPAEVRASLKESKYAAWRIDKIKKVETPAGNFYQVLVDNLNLQIDADHMGFTENLVLNFQPGGELSGSKSISSALLF